MLTSCSHTLYVTTRLNAHLTRYSRFPRIGQVACLLTTTEDRHGTSRDVRFLLTSLTPPQADPARLLTIAHGHWSIESRHWVRDVVFSEDRSPLRTGDAPQFLAAVRNLAYTLIRRSGTTAIAAARRSFSYHPARARPPPLPALEFTDPGSLTRDLLYVNFICNIEGSC